MYSLYQETGDTEQYNCLDSCIYQDKANPGHQFCFQAGNLPVSCLEDQPDTATQAQGRWEVCSMSNQGIYYRLQVWSEEQAQDCGWDGD